jgi:hypothetical protein
MREMLKITAEIEGDQLHDGDLFAVERFIPTEMRQEAPGILYHRL